MPKREVRKRDIRSRINKWINPKKSNWRKILTREILALKMKILLRCYLKKR
jgi:hypothetical protein